MAKSATAAIPTGCWLKDWTYVQTTRNICFTTAQLFGQIAGQLQGLLWKDGGPVISVQIENEYAGQAEHLLSLKRLACEAGLDVPLYTRTGWPDLATPMPLGELLPLFGGYADGFWDRSLEEMPAAYQSGFFFTSVRADAAIATDQLGERAVKKDADDGYYPYFGCEIGGGMECSYHRRIRIACKDIEALALIKIGSGNNLQGYYMYHGGTNPEGVLSTLQESQATGMWNDLPVKSYDFQAPLGEFGQVRPHFHALRRLHLFLRDFGGLLAPMPARLPETERGETQAHTSLRWAVRAVGRSGFLFVSNYQRLQPLPASAETRFELCFPEACLLLPDKPITVPADTAFFWPFGLDLAGVHLIYATAQPVCSLKADGIQYFVFAEVPDVGAEFVFDNATASAKAPGAVVTESEHQIRVDHLTCGPSVAIHLQTPEGQAVSILLLSAKESLACWKGDFAGRERLFLTEASLMLDGDALCLSGSDNLPLSVGIFPSPDKISADGICLPSVSDGIFYRYVLPSANAFSEQVTGMQIQPAGPARQILMGREGVAEAPVEAEFAAARIWRLCLPQNIDVSRTLRLCVTYQGDVARLYLDGELLGDNFYNGDIFELSLTRFAPEIYEKELLLKILPLCRNAPIYLPETAWPDFGTDNSVAELHMLTLVEERTGILIAG